MKRLTPILLLLLLLPLSLFAQPPREWAAFNHDLPRRHAYRTIRPSCRLQ
ncbi:MAG TPA: hypothetical protein VGQ51_13455 [Puia sp.]|nr:hypothetical protein [Puia sp.]